MFNNIQDILWLINASIINTRYEYITISFAYAKENVTILFRVIFSNR